MSILGRFLALRMTTVSLLAAGWWQMDTRISPRPNADACVQTSIHAAGFYISATVKLLESFHRYKATSVSRYLFQVLFTLLISLVKKRKKQQLLLGDNSIHLCMQLSTYTCRWTGPINSGVTIELGAPANILHSVIAFGKFVLQD